MVLNFDTLKISLYGGLADTLIYMEKCSSYRLKIISFLGTIEVANFKYFRLFQIRPSQLLSVNIHLVLSGLIYIASFGSLNLFK